MLHKIPPFLFAVLGLAFALSASAAPTCKRLDDKQLVAALVEADRSLAQAVDRALDPAITAEVGTHWVAGDAALDSFFARSSEIALKSAEAKLMERHLADIRPAVERPALLRRAGVAPDSESDAMSASQLLIANRKRMVALLRTPTGGGSNGRAFEGAVGELRRAAGQFLNSTTELLSHYNCDAMPKAEAPLVPGSACVAPASPSEQRCVAPSASTYRPAKPLLYSAPMSRPSYEGGSSSSGGAK